MVCVIAVKVDEDDDWDYLKCFHKKKDAVEYEYPFAEFSIHISKKQGIIRFVDKEGGIKEFADALRSESEEEWELMNQLIDQEHKQKYRQTY